MESSQLETELQENMDILDRDIFTLNESVEMGEVTQEELEFEILKEKARFGHKSTLVVPGKLFLHYYST